MASLLLEVGGGVVALEAASVAILVVALSLAQELVVILDTSRRQIIPAMELSRVEALRAFVVDVGQALILAVPRVLRVAQLRALPDVS